jgi:hypothetical protein
MAGFLTDFSQDAKRVYRFRPWVRRAGLSIVLVAAAISGAIAFALAAIPGARYGWIGERFVWVYIGTLWLGGLKVWTGTLRPIAEVGADSIVLRPLHQLRGRLIAWDQVRGTEQLIGGDRLIVYYDTPRGMRFVALNLNLVKGRKDFLAVMEAKLTAMDFTERVVERSRYRTRAA